MDSQNKRVHDELVLGLDIGTSSIGWALVKQAGGTPAGIHACGVRIFPTGVNVDAVSGKNESRNADRRAARQRRRMLDRRQMRKAFVTKTLHGAGLLPPGRPSTNEVAWQELLQTDPYKLRAKALDQPLEPHEFGRVILHLCQRRGFLSNRKAPAKKDEKPGLVLQKTTALNDQMQKSGARTLGEFLAGLDPAEQRRRGHYTLRAWYRAEFNAIWAAQQSNTKLALNDDLRKKLERGLFFQRPLRKNEKALGHCEFELNRPRAAMALLASQRFRLLQDVNHTRVFVAAQGVERDLTPDERTTLITALETQSKLTFAKARKLLRLNRHDSFNMEEGGREEFTGNTTAARVVEVLGDRWKTLSEPDRQQMVEDLMSMQNENALVSRAKRVWGLNDQEAEAFADIELEDGHLRLSTKAIRKILPHLEVGLAYAEAAAKAYPDRVEPPQTDVLPPVENLRNPMVQRALAELRRVVNAVVRCHGKPGRVRIELARDLKQNARGREESWRDMRAREKQRKSALSRVMAEAGIKTPKPSDIEKALLWDECGGVCPYTGKGMGLKDLFGEAPQFDVEHIIPFSRSLDNSFANKTLCDVSENRNIKRNKTPYEAYGSSAKWDEVIGRVRSFSGDYRDEKLRRFLLQSVEGEQAFADQFSSSQLNDTRYASRKAAGYVAQLYPVDERRTRIQVSAGRTTAYLRNGWRLNGLLKDGDTKSRDDHRHHVVDAVVVALTTPGTTRALTEAATRTSRPGVFDNLPTPWTGFADSVRQALQGVTVSRRVDRGVGGPLHKETYYGVIKTEGHSCRAVVRKPISALTDAEMRKDSIVDPVIRRAVNDKLRELGLPPAKAFQDGQNTPTLLTKAGKAIPIRKVRVFTDVSTEDVGTGGIRHVLTGSNHHLEVFAVQDKKGQPTWRGVVVSRLEAMKRKKLGQPIVRRVDESGNPLVFSLAIGDMVRMKWNGTDVVANVQKLSDHNYVFRSHADARMAKDSRSEAVEIRSDNTFCATGCQKLSVDPLGVYHVSHD